MEKGGVTVCKRRNWAFLLHELLVSISQRLVISDHVRFGAVCRSWASATKESSPLPWPWPWPWLSIIRETTDQKLQHSLYDFSSNKLYKKPIPSSITVLGHKEGWIVFLFDMDQPVVMNPLTVVRHRLPSFSTIPDHIYFDGITKIVLTAVPNSSGNFPVFAIAILEDLGHPGFEHIAYTSLGDSKWTHIYSLHDDDDDEILDGVYHEGIFYAILKSGQLLHFDIPTTPSTDQEPPRLANKLPISKGTDMLLVSAPPRRGGSDLLHVRVRRRRSLTSDIIEDITIMKFDREANRWVIVNDLDGGCLFLDLEGAMLLPDVPGLKGNCVYFTDEYTNSQDELVHLVRVLDLEETTPKPYPPCSRILFHCANSHTAPTWFLPSLS